jgi:GDP-mannose 6-dehydrogenase
MPHLASLLRDDVRAVVRESDIIVASQRCAAVAEIREAARAGQVVVDVNGWRELDGLPWSYEGLCW